MCCFPAEDFLSAQTQRGGANVTMGLAFAPPSVLELGRFRFQKKNESDSFAIFGDCVNCKSLTLMMQFQILDIAQMQKQSCQFC